MASFVYYTGLAALFFVLVAILYSFLVVAMYNYQSYIIQKEKRALSKEVLTDWIDNQ